MKASTSIAIFACFIAVPVLALLAEPDGKPQTKPVPNKPVASDAPPDEQPAGKTIKLDFTITNDDGKHSFPVVCAARSFHSERDIVEADGGHQFKITGYMKPVDAKDRAFVYFDLLRYHSNDTDGTNATFKLKGSAIVTFGKKTEIGTLGDEKITLTAIVVE